MDLRERAAGEDDRSFHYDARAGDSLRLWRPDSRARTNNNDVILSEAWPVFGPNGVEGPALQCSDLRNKRLEALLKSLPHLRGR
jgi:hypothetical protein